MKSTYLKFFTIITITIAIYLLSVNLLVQEPDDLRILILPFIILYGGFSLFKKNRTEFISRFRKLLAILAFIGFLFPMYYVIVSLMVGSFEFVSSLVPLLYLSIASTVLEYNKEKNRFKNEESQI